MNRNLPPYCEKQPARRTAPANLRSLAWCLLALPGLGPHAAVVGPVSSGMTVRSNTCTDWDVVVTYTAKALEPDDYDGLMGFTHYTASNHLHHNLGNDYLSLTLENQFRATNSVGRVAEINQKIFGTDTPTIGQTSSAEYVHSGGCALDKGLRECVGIIVAPGSEVRYPRGTEPTVFPLSARCLKIPPAAGSCMFDAPSASRDLGAIGPKGGGTDIPLTYRCTGSPPTYQIRMDGGESTLAVTPPVGTVALTAGGKTLPIVVDGSSGAHTVTLHAVFSPESGKSGAFQAVGTVILDLL